MSRCLHLSDTHGIFPEATGSFDFVVHSGDFFPNSHEFRTGNRKDEGIFQLNWIKKHIGQLRRCLQDKPFIFILGNHDFCDASKLEGYLKSEGIEAYNIENKLLNFNGLSFYGFPYIPYINGVWNYELRINDMQKQVDKMVNEINTFEKLDFLVCHAPPYGIMDKTYYGQNVGNTALVNALNHKFKIMPKNILFGHIHEANGIALIDNIIYSNAGTTKHVIEVNG